LSASRNLAEAGIGAALAVENREASRAQINSSFIEEGGRREVNEKFALKFAASGTEGDSTQGGQAGRNK